MHVCSSDFPSSQNELAHVGAILMPDRPFLAVVAGSKYDTKIGPLSALYKVVDHLILGGVVSAGLMAGHPS